MYDTTTTVITHNRDFLSFFDYDCFVPFEKFEGDEQWYKTTIRKFGHIN